MVDLAKEYIYKNNKFYDISSISKEGIPVNVVNQLPSTGNDGELYVVEKPVEESINFDFKSNVLGDTPSQISTIKLGSNSEKFVIYCGREVITVPAGAGPKEDFKEVVFPKEFKQVPVILLTPNDISGVVGEYVVANSALRNKFSIIAGRNSGNNGEIKVGVEWIALGTVED